MPTFPYNDTERERHRIERQRRMQRIARVCSTKHLLWQAQRRGAALYQSPDMHPEEPLCLDHKSEWSGSYHTFPLPSPTKPYIPPRHCFVQTKWPVPTAQHWERRWFVMEKPRGISRVLQMLFFPHKAQQQINTQPGGCIFSLCDGEKNCVGHLVHTLMSVPIRQRYTEYSQVK